MNKALLKPKIPVTVITGFLGSGKTTLVRNILKSGKRIAFIVNEFGDFGVDGDLIKGCNLENCMDDDVIELNNGCICCTVADEFIPTMTKILGRPKRPEHIIIETSGLALPKPLVAAFNWPEISTELTIDGVIAVVDAGALAEGQFAADPKKIAQLRELDRALDHQTTLAELFEDQLNAADLVILNKVDLLSEVDRKAITEKIRNCAIHQPRLIETSFGNIQAEVLLGLEVASEKHIAGRKTHHDTGDETDHDHDEFRSLVVELPEVEDRSRLMQQLEQIIEHFNILRLKGFISVKNKPMRLVVQAVGRRINSYFDVPWQKVGKNNSHLVLIGFSNDIDETAIKSVLMNEI